MIKIWFLLDLFAVFLITFRDDCKMFYDTITYDFKQKTYIYWLFLIFCFALYLPFTIPHSLIIIVNKINGNKNNKP